LQLDDEMHRLRVEIEVSRSKRLVKLADKDPEATMLDFVQPTGSGGGTVDERRFARADETGRRGPGMRATTCLSSRTFFKSPNEQHTRTDHHVARMSRTENGTLSGSSHFEI
jgi:hypothetical protein